MIIQSSLPSALYWGLLLSALSDLVQPKYFILKTLGYCFSNPQVAAGGQTNKLNMYVIPFFILPGSLLGFSTVLLYKKENAGEY